MSKITAGCGHEIKDFRAPISIKDVSGCANVVSVMVCCEKCEKYYKTHKLILKTKAAEMKWLRR